MQPCSRALKFFLATACLAFLLPATSTAQDAAADEWGTWITLGADAFDELTRQGLRFLDQPLVTETEVVLEGDIVVATRVASRDLARVSEMLHEKWLRCPGFIAHRSRADALGTLSALESAGFAEVEGIDYEINQGPLVADLVSRLDQTSILSTIEHLSTHYANRYYQHPSGVASATWIRDQWRSLAQGRSDVTVEFFDHPWPQPSVILSMEGASPGVVVLGGHQDSIASGTGNPNFSAPGADDNASGIAVLTEVIRAAMEAGYKPDRTVHFMAYAAEEVGLWGSQEIAADFEAANTDVVAVLQLDMTAYQGSPQDIGFLSDFTNGALTDFAKSLVDTYQPELNWVDTACNYGCSDHAAWHNEGFPTVMSAESIVGDINPAIHSTSDTVSTFGSTADHSIKFARLATALMVEVAGSAADSVVFLDDFESGDLSAWSAAVN